MSIEDLNPDEVDLSLHLVKHSTDRLYTLEKADGRRYPGWYTQKNAKQLKKLIQDIAELHNRQIEPSAETLKGGVM